MATWGWMLGRSDRIERDRRKVGGRERFGAKLNEKKIKNQGNAALNQINLL